MKCFIFLIYVTFYSQILCENVVVHLNHKLWLNQSRIIKSYALIGTTITYIVEGFNENYTLDWYKYEVFGNPVKLKEEGKYFMQYGDNFANLTITNLTKMDKGQYSTFQLTNNKWNIFKLSVRGLAVHMNTFYYFQNSSKEVRIIECRIYRYGNETVTFKLNKNPNRSFDFETIPNQKIHFEKPLYETGVAIFYLSYIFKKSEMLRCSANNHKNISTSTTIPVIIGPYPDYFIIIPRDISHNISESSIVAPIGKNLLLDCLVVSQFKRGDHEIKWFKNNHTLIDVSYDKDFLQIKGSKIISNINFTVTTLVIKSKQNETSEKYSCQAAVKGPRDPFFDDFLKAIIFEERHFLVIFKVLPITQNPIVIWIPVTIIFLMVIILGILFIKRKKTKAKINQNKIYEMALNTFFEAEPILYEFIKNLQYDENFEFPENKLKLGKYIGMGNFGIVQKALAIGISKTEEKTLVAVKSVSDSNNLAALGALISEMRVLIHLGKHINVVNFLAAVSKDFIKGNLKVIVEYCPYGNLQKFLKNNRHIFFNQIDPNTDEINEKTGYQMHKRDDDYINPGDIPISFTSVANLNKNEAKMNYSSSIAQLNNNDKKNTNLIPYKIITTIDLICWAYQITFGMTYIAKRKIIHGDLAARNILLAENNIVKICDFGLAKAMSSQYENYNNKKEEELPLKWLALESLETFEFSTKSDIWSFGIVLWELFTLGENPYSDVNVRGAQFINLIKNGYRMNKPDFCNKNIYNIMLKCWNPVPANRPSFSELQEELSTYLESDSYEKINQLNAPFEKANTEYFSKIENTYLEIRNISEVVYANSTKIHDVEQQSKSENLDKNS